MLKHVSNDLILKFSAYHVAFYASTFIDPYGVKDPRRGNLNSETLQEHNATQGYSKMIGDPNKGLADDTTVHPFGDLRINFARMNSSNLCFWWEYDFTGGVVRNNGQNSLLSDEVKTRIYNQHKTDPEKFSVERLAEMYKIRHQRVMAILILKEIAEEQMAQMETVPERYRNIHPPAIEEGSPQEAVVESTDNGEVSESKNGEKKLKTKISDEKWFQFCDWAEREAFGATAMEGSGERHFVSVPTYPKFEEIPLSEAHKYTTTEWSISKVNRLYTDKEDKFQVREFKESLELNTGKIGQSLDLKTDREKMRRSPPKTPTGVVITSLDEEMKAPYVAEVDGTQRSLNPDEYLIWKRTNRESFRRLIKQKIKKHSINETKC